VSAGPPRGDRGCGRLRRLRHRSDSSLQEVLNESARLRPSETAIRSEGPSGSRTMDFHALSEWCASLSSQFRTHAVGKGAVLVEAPSELTTPVVLLSVLFAGRTALPVSPETTRAELKQLVERIGADAGIGRPSFLNRLPAEVGARIDSSTVERKSGGSSPSLRDELSEGGLLLQSSGTGGPPKIVRRDASALLAVGQGVAKALSLGPGDGILLTIPLFHSYGLDLLLAALVSGCRLEVHDHFVPSRAVASLRSGEVTVWPAVPLMLDVVSRGKSLRPLSSALRRVVSAGSPLPIRVYEQFRASYGVRVGQIYGASEFGTVACSDPAEDAFDPASVGRPLPGVKLVVEPAGGEGEVLVAAPSMMTEYVGEPTPLGSDGLFRTGDLGRVDDAGCLTLTGRIKLMIDIGGQKVNPLEVEQVLAEHPQVREAVVLPIPWSDTADRHRALIIPELGLLPDLEELRRFARARLSPHKVPRVFSIESEVPRSATGKISRRALQERFNQKGKGS